jgi:hypothetical protein
VVETVITGPVQTDTTWTKSGSPYRLPGGVAVLKRATLTIESGVSVVVGPSQYIRVEGGLRAIGNTAEPILFTRDLKQPGAWSGLWIVGTPEDPSTGAILDYATIEYGGGGGNGNVSVTNSQAPEEHDSI